MLDPKDYKLVFKTIADDGSVIFLTKDQIDYIIYERVRRNLVKKASEQRKQQKQMSKNKRRYFNPRLN